MARAEEERRPRGAAAGLAVLAAALVLGAPLLEAAPAALLGLGDSIGEGVQSADASFVTQPHSYLSLAARQIGVPLDLPWIVSGPLGVVGDATRRARIFPSVPGANLAVSGTDVSGLLRRRADALTEDEIDSETDLVLFPRLGSQVEIAEAAGAFAVFCWIGNNDVLSAAIDFDHLDASQMTPVEEFEADFREVADRLTRSAVLVVFGTVPDVTRIAFLLDRDRAAAMLGRDPGLAPGEYTTLAAVLLVRIGAAGPEIFQDPDFVLDASEAARIRDRVDAFNRIIVQVAAETGALVADVHGFLESAAQDPPVLAGLPVTASYLGGLFSLDGVHPSDTGHALLANVFLEAVNRGVGTAIPLIAPDELETIFRNDPSVDKDGDGRCRGRFGAGLLETLGPFLGISGDADDAVPAPVPAAAAAGALELVRAAAEAASDSPVRTDVRAIKEVLRLGPLGATPR